MKTHTAANESPETLRKRYGENALPGETRDEQAALYLGAIMTVLMTGDIRATFLYDTATNGGC